MAKEMFSTLDELRWIVASFRRQFRLETFRRVENHDLGLIFPIQFGECRRHGLSSNGFERLFLTHVFRVEKRILDDAEQIAERIFTAATLIPPPTSWSR